MRNWRNELEVWLAPFLGALGHKARERMCPAYIAGLIGPGDRKSIQPMAARLGEDNYDRLNHFISSGVWDAKPLETVLLAEADRMVGGANTQCYSGTSREATALAMPVLPQLTRQTHSAKVVLETTVRGVYRDAAAEVGGVAFTPATRKALDHDMCHLPATARSRPCNPRM